MITAQHRTTNTTSGRHRDAVRFFDLATPPNRNKKTRANGDAKVEEALEKLTHSTKAEVIYTITFPIIPHFPLNPITVT